MLCQCIKPFAPMSAKTSCALSKALWVRSADLSFLSQSAELLQNEICHGSRCSKQHQSLHYMYEFWRESSAVKIPVAIAEYVASSLD